MTTMQPWKKASHWSRTYFSLATQTYFLLIRRKIWLKICGKPCNLVCFLITDSGWNSWCPCDLQENQHLQKVFPIGAQKHIGVPPKNACFFCFFTKPKQDEVLPSHNYRKIRPYSTQFWPGFLGSSNILYVTFIEIHCSWKKT